MPDLAAPSVVALPAARLGEVRPLLLNLLDEDQRHYSGELSSPAAIESLVGKLAPGFSGENLLLGIDEDGRLAAFCWCVFFDPGTGYEAEVAELYVRPEYRGRGYARALVRAAVETFKARGVTFAAVWTHPSNEAAVALYRAAGFAPTEQLVLTWLPAAR